jgi:hypothetical protein
VPVAAAARAAELVIWAANGCVASTTARGRCCVSQSASPSGPPNPPIRTSPSGSTGSATRPASEESTSTPAATSAAASRRASPVPPSTST